MRAWVQSPASSKEAGMAGILVTQHCSGREQGQDPWNLLAGQSRLRSQWKRLSKEVGSSWKRYQRVTTGFHTHVLHTYTHTHRGLITYIKIANDLGTFEHILKNTQNNAKTEPQFLSLCIWPSNEHRIGTQGLYLRKRTHSAVPYQYLSSRIH